MKIIEGKNIILRTVEMRDAEFILELRMLSHKNKYLSKVDNDIEKQKNWLVGYKEREREGREYYLLIESKKGDKLGLVRIYDFIGDSFCWGSWLIKDDAPKTTAIESALQVYEFAFGELDYRKSHFEVRKQNIKVVKFHLRFGARIVNEDELNYYFNYSSQKYQTIKDKYKRYLGN